MRILEFKEFRRLILEDEPAPAADPAAAMPPPPDPAAAMPPPPPPMDMGMPAALPPDPNAAPAGPTSTTGLKFIFIQDAENKKWHGSHGEAGGTKRFTQYEVSPDDLTKWLEVHKLDKEKDLVLAALAGRRPMPETVYSTFKKEVIDGDLGSDKGTLDIKFDSDDNFSHPSTTDLEVVFLKSK
jgi:hypothetical protein